MQAQMDSTSERNQFPLQKGGGGKEKNVNVLKGSKDRRGEGNVGLYNLVAVSGCCLGYIR